MKNVLYGARRPSRGRIPVALAAALMLAPLLAAVPAAAQERSPLAAETGGLHSTEEETALQQAAESGEPVEVLARRTETSQTFANPSGTFTDKRYATAQRVRQGNKLVDINTTLATTADGSIYPRATSVGLKFSGGGTGPLVTIVQDGRSMSLAWPTALPKPQIEEDTVTYPEVLPDVDLKLQAGASGYSQLLVVKSARAAANPELKAIDFKLATDGVTVSADKHGNMTATNPAGQAVFVAPTPRMWDSSKTESPAKAARSLSAARTLAAAEPPPSDEFEPGHGAQESSMPISVSTNKVTLTPDQSLLTSDDTTYPVYIDPAVEGVREAWTIAYKKAPNTAYYNGAGWRNSDGTTGTKEARVGYENETNGLARSFFRMDTNNLWNTKKQIISSTFRIKNTWSWSCEDRRVETWQTNPISTSTTWNNQPTWARELDWVSDAKGWGPSCPAGNLAFNVTSAAKDAATKKLANITLGMKAASEGDVYAWKRFEAGSAELSTEYNSLPGNPTGLDTIPSSGGCDTAAPYTMIGNTDVKLTAKVSDPDGGTLRVNFRLWGSNDLSGDAAIVNQIVSYTSGSVAKVTVPKATLQAHLAAAKGNFAWAVQAIDASNGASAWTPVGAACRFDFDPTRPSTPPAIASAVFPDGSDGWPQTTGEAGQAALFTFTNGGVTDVAKYEYWTDWDLTVRTANRKNTTDPTDLAEVQLSPPAAGSMRVYVHSIDGAGNRSDRASYFFYANSPSKPSKPGDLNRDGYADFYGVRPDGELWLYPGQGNGNVGTYSVVSNADFTGASVTHRGDWSGDGSEDLVAAIPGEDGKTLQVFPNNGLGWACTARNEQADGHSQMCMYDQEELKVYNPGNDHWTNADQILAIGDVDGPLDTDGDGTMDIPGHTDLIVKEGGLLWLYYGSDTFYLDEYRDPVLVGTSSWASYDLAAPGDHTGNGRVDLIARHKTTGDLRLYKGTGPNGEGLGTGPDSVVIGTHWTASNRPLMSAVPDANGDGKSDMWATGGDGKLYFYASILGSGVVVGNSGWANFRALN